MKQPIDEQTLRAIIEAAPDGILAIDADGRIRFANTQVEHLFGYKRDELIGKRIELLVPEAERATHSRHRERYAASPATRPMGSGLDLRALRKDGSEFVVEISLSPVEGPGGPLVAAVVRDVSAHRALTEERQQLVAQVEAQLVRDAVARDLHDEIIQAVYAVGLNLQAARSAGKAGTGEAIERAREELSAVIADLRSYIRHLTSGGQPVPTQLLETRLRALLERRHPPPAWSVEIELGDASTAGLDRELYLIARELVSNVERHAGAERARFALRAEPEGFRIEVEDDGRGFERSAVHDDAVGLRSVEQRVAELDGSMLIESHPGAGTRVIARIPRPLADEG